MLLENLCLQGSQILEVKEKANGQLVDILFDLAPDMDNNFPGKKLLRLQEVVSYTRKEIPSSHSPVVRSIKVLHSPDHTHTVFADTTTANYKIEIITNTGKRVLEFADWNWYDLSNEALHAVKMKEPQEKVGVGFY